MRIKRRGRLFCEAVIEDMSVTALHDGYVDLPPDDLRGLDREPWPADQMQDVPLFDGMLRLDVNAFFVRGPEGGLLIDAGAGNSWHATMGRLPEAMAEAGIEVDDVTEVALTHTHRDHFGGLVTPDGAPAYPSARRIWVATEELGLFRSKDRLAPVLDRLMPLEQGDGPMRGVVAINAPGHEVGHMAFLVERRLLIWGDLVHVPTLQFAQPQVSWYHDADQEMARETRARLFERALESGLMVAGAHLDFPAFGHLRREGGAYGFVPMGSQV